MGMWLFLVSYSR